MLLENCKSDISKIKIFSNVRFNQVFTESRFKSKQRLLHVNIVWRFHGDASRPVKTFDFVLLSETCARHSVPEHKSTDCLTAWSGNLVTLTYTANQRRFDTLTLGNNGGLLSCNLFGWNFIYTTFFSLACNFVRFI